jgi:TonB-dependent starch-binding outer membrane protein SusC
MIKSYRITCLFVAVFVWLSAPDVQCQTRTVSGHVKSTDDNLGLPGVSVVEKGTNNGTVSDANGFYSIQTQGTSSTLVFSFVGYQTVELEVNNNTTVDVSLSPDIATLQEVVVVGYSEVKKSDATGAVAVVGQKAFNKGVVNSPQELFSGKAAGVVVTSNSGAPGNTSTIRIRGGSSLNASNDPLIVVDGVPVSNTNLGGSPNVLSFINPNDIESISILKDASAGAIYGLRAANGVIIITTKRGQRDMKITYSGTATIYNAPKKVDVLNGDDFRALITDRYAGQASVLGLLGDANTDWQNEIYRTSFGQDHNVTLSATKFNTPFRISVGHNNTDGILKTYNYKRTSFSLAADPKLLNDKLKISVNVKGMLNHNNFADQGAIGDAISYDPTKPVFNGNTRWRGYTTWTTGGINGNSINLAPGNPVARLDMTDNTSVVKRSIGNLKADYELPFLADLHAILNLGYDYTDTEGHNNVRDSTQWIYLPTVAGGKKNPYESTARNQLLDFYLNYTKDIPSAKSKVEVLGGYSWAEFYSKGNDYTANENNEDTTRNNAYETQYNLLSFFGRLNYTFRDKYIFTGTLRDDATSRFSKEHRWGVFPAMALAWKIHQENFMSGSRVISDLKLRVGYGVTGQQDIYGNDYPYIATYTRSDDASRYRLGDTFYNTLRPDGYEKNIRWEKTTTVNAGLDLGFLENKLTASLDVYEKESTDQIAYIPVPVGTNFTSALTTNVGAMKNRGIELSLNADILSTDKIQWSVGYNVAYNRNKITKLNLTEDPDFFIPLGGVGGTTAGTIQAHMVGHPRAAFYVYEQAYDAEGNPLEDVYVDRNDDGRINTSDLYIFKQPDPVITMGINSQFSYGSFDFAFNARVCLDNYMYNNVAANSTYGSLYNSMGYLSNVASFANDTKFATGANTRFSNYYLENGSFFRMDNINAGYTFRQVYADRLNIRVGLGVQNAFVITKYSGLDPEVSGGLDNNYFPRTRSYFFNVNFEF